MKSVSITHNEGVSEATDARSKDLHASCFCLLKRTAAPGYIEPGTEPTPSRIAAVGPYLYTKAYVFPMVQLPVRMLRGHQLTMLGKFVQQPNVLQEVANRGQQALADMVSRSPVSN